MKALGIASAALLITVVHVRSAAACDFALAEIHQVDEDEAALDDQAPEVIGATYTLSEGDDGSDIGCAASSCDGSPPILTLSLVASDNRSDIAAIGFIIEVVDGEVPVNFEGSAYRSAYTSNNDAQLPFIWTGGRSASATLRITPIDLAGNMGAAIELEIDEAESGGCSVVTLSPPCSAGLLCLVALIVALGRRRRRNDDDGRRCRA